MFTGLIETMGRIEAITLGHKPSLTIMATGFPGLRQDGIVPGDSIAVNGVCLTADSIHHEGFKSSVMPVTLERTNLGKLKPGSAVNLERALRLGDRMDGHMVSGHIDAVGRVVRLQNVPSAKLITISVPDAIACDLVTRGSIAVDGVSLTVAAMDGASFTISLVEHTRGATTLARLEPGDAVNIETDILMKYVRKTMEGTKSEPKSLTLETLAGYGF